MATIKSINVAVRATTSDLESGMKRAGGVVNDFGEKKLKLSNAAKVLAGSLGGTGSALGEMAKNFVEFGPAIGGAMAAVELAKGIFESQAEAIKKASEQSERYQKVMEELRDFATGSPVGDIGSVYAEQIKKIDDEIKQIYKDNEVSYGLGFIKMEKNPINWDRVLALEDMKKALAETQTEIAQPIDEAKARFEELKFAANADLKGGSLEQIQAQFKAAAEYANTLADTLDSMPPIGRDFEKIQKEWQAGFLAAKSLQDQMVEKQKELTKESGTGNFTTLLQKSMEFGLKGIEQMKTEAGKIFDDTRSPFEVFESRLKKLKELFEGGFINEDTFNRGAKQALEQFDQADKKLNPDHGGAARQIDTSLIDVRGLVNQKKDKQEVHSPQFEKANTLLKDISVTLKGGVTAVAG